MKEKRWRRSWPVTGCAVPRVTCGWTKPVGEVEGYAPGRTQRVWAQTQTDARSKIASIPLGEWRDLTDAELIALFKLIEGSSSDAKPKPKAKPKTAGIKRPVVKMEKTSEKPARPAANGKRFVSPGRKKKGR